MNSGQQNSKLKKWAKRVAWAVAVIAALVLILRLSLKTPFVQNYVKSYILSTANAQLNAELTIDDLSGDLWDDVTLTGIRLAKKDTIARVDSLHISYNILSLLGSEFEISQLGIYSPAINLRQQGEAWNVQNIVESSDTTQSSFAFRIDNLAVDKGSVSVQSDSLPVEPDFVVNGLSINSSLAMGAEKFDVNLRDLSFRVEQTQLDAPLRVETSARADSNSITLEKLMLATGNSVIRSSAFASKKDSAVRLDLSASPVSWKDVATYAKGFPLNENLQVDLGVSGTLEQFKFTLNAQGEGLQSLEIGSRLGWQKGLVLQQFSIESGHIDPEVLLSDTTLPSIQSLKGQFTGEIYFDSYEKSHGDASLAVSQISSPPYRLDELSASLELKGQSALIKLETHRQQQKVSSQISVQQIWAELPKTKVTVEGANMNPAYWMQDTTYAGNFSFRSELSGRGFYPDSTLWDYSLTVNEGRFMEQHIANFSAEGKVSSQKATLDGTLKVKEGVLRLMADVRNFDSNPAYNFSLESRNLNMGPMAGTEDFTTAINAKISGRGRGLDPASMRLQSSIKIDSSLVNGESIRNLSANISIRDSVAVVDSAGLQSTIAEGSFNAHLNILRFYDPENGLSLNLTLKDLNSLSPLFNVEKLQAEGEISGKVSPVDAEKLQFTGTVDLTEIVYNELFTMDGAKGSVELQAKENLEYRVDLNLSSPSFSGIQLQNMQLSSQGIYFDSTANGNFGFQFSSPNEGRIEHAGNYFYAPDSIRVHTTELNIVSNYRTLSLENPFNLWIQSDTIRMDTMRVSSSEAFLEAAVPLITPDEQHGFIQGEALNTTVIQNSLFGEPYFEGMFSGRLEVARVDTSMQAQGQLLFTDLMYREASLDSLFMETRIKDERLKGTMFALHEGNRLVEAEVSLPFQLGDPKKLPDKFFDQPISGQVNILDISLDRFEKLFAEAEITNTAGIFSFHGTLGGTAGKPEFGANATLEDATLSGVSVDSITAGMDYRHSESLVALNASVMSLKQKAAQVDAIVPLFINMKTFEVELPQEKDSISVEIETNDFNLAALNDFLDPATAKEVEGKLNGMVEITGTPDDLKTDGQLEVSEGSFRLVPAGIQVDDIQTAVIFAPNQLRLKKFSAESGSGSLKAGGTLELEKLEPGNMDIKINAESFTAANTDEYNATIDLDARAQGTFTQPKVSGSLSFLSGFVELGNFGEESVESVRLDSAARDTSQFSVYDSLSLDMNVSFNRRFFVRNERYLEMEIELEGALDLLKESGQDLQLFGTMNAVSGYALPLGKRFELQEGAVTFTGPPTNPALLIRTQYEPPQPEEEIVIWYIIEGTVEDPKFKYESQPPMELENILSYTLFGQPFYALDSWKQVVASSGGGNTTAADVALDVLLDRVETLATQKLGIDVVKIDNTNVGGENGTSITTGWYINPKVFFAIQNVITGSSPDTSFLLEYLLRENLELIIRQGNGIRQGVDIRWEYDY